MKTPLPVPTPWTPIHRAVLAGAVVIGLALGWLGRSADIGLGGDEATYVTLSHSLESGRYNDEFLVGTPRHAQYPPGNPAWIMAIRKVAGDDLDPVRAVNLLAIALSAVLLADSLRRLGLTAIGVAAGALTAVNPALGALAGTALSEAPFVLFTSLALWATTLIASARVRLGVPLAAAFALLAFMTRSIGVATIAAIVVAALRRARLVTTLIVLAGIVGIAAAWFGYTRSAASTSIGHSYAVDLAQAPPSLSGVMVEAASKAANYVVHLPAYQLGFPNAPGTKVETALFAALLLLLLIAGFIPLVRSWPEAATLILGSGGVLLLWPWPDTRLLTPVMPWIIVTLLLGARAVAMRLRVPHPDRVMLLTAAMIGTFGVITAAGTASRTRGCRAEPPYQAAACFRPEHRDLAKAIAFVRDSLPSRAVINTTKPSTVFVLSGRQTIPPWDAFAEDGVERFRRGELGTHILLSGLLGEEHRAANGPLGRDCTGLVAVAAFPRAVLLAPRPPSGEGADACVHIARLAAASKPE